MLIKNTDGSYCKIKDIKVSGLKAYITVVIYSSIPQTSKDTIGNIHRVFSFYLRDLEDTKLYKLSHNNYWIDRNNSYNNDSNNIDINMYKEIILEVDITNNNLSEMQYNKWIRKCAIVLMDITTSTKEEAWVSENITLVSKEIKLPELSNLKVSLNKDSTISISYNYNYENQEDFNYIDTNIITSIIIKSFNSNTVIESREFFPAFTNNLNKHIEFKSIETYTTPINIIINFKNLKGDILYHTYRFFDPSFPKTNLYIQDSTPIHIKSVTIKDENIQHIKSIQVKQGG